MSCTSKSGDASFDGNLEDETKRLSYAVGMEVGGSLKGMGAEIDIAAFSAGAASVLEGSEPLLSDQEANEVKRTVFSRLQQERAQEMKSASADNVKDAGAFFEKNAKRDGVTTTASGLQYEVLRKGTGKQPSADARVRVHYRGTLLDGTEFDNSHSRGEPAVFGVNQVIKGWSEGLQLMRVGGKYKLFVPADLAYGERAMGDKITPNSALIFEVELLGIE
ncbi:MAG: FKBP-type peptidyl-prolyl cis-trans isomerase [Chitinivibrionales bacterium]|nr:FKBP-type peptidyl-prolyl cis-trans isomerase [Chitinivibrionales bacterium]MBD3395337.1 FKBP-type peptidyl-prolyl cis-trans isomerase [Chitinivibrionales bacterium]